MKGKIMAKSMGKKGTICGPNIKSSTVSTAFMEIVQKLHGSPKIIVSDRDPIFTGHFWT
jgi:hypothetical protein